MDGFTPQFWWQVLITVAAVAAGVAALKADIKNLKENFNEERNRSKAHAEQDDNSFHDVRDELAGHHGRLSRLEGANDLADQIATALRR